MKTILQPNIGQAGDPGPGASAPLHGPTSWLACQPFRTPPALDSATNSHYVGSTLAVMRCTCWRCTSVGNAILADVRLPRERSMVCTGTAQHSPGGLLQAAVDRWPCVLHQERGTCLAANTGAHRCFPPESACSRILARPMARHDCATCCT